MVSQCGILGSSTTTSRAEIANLVDKKKFQSFTFALDRDISGNEIAIRPPIWYDLYLRGTSLERTDLYTTADQSIPEFLSVRTILQSLIYWSVPSSTPYSMPLRGQTLCQPSPIPQDSSGVLEDGVQQDGRGRDFCRFFRTP